MHSPPETTRFRACPLCEAICGLEIRVDDAGRPLSIRGDAAAGNDALGDRGAVGGPGRSSNDRINDMARQSAFAYVQAYRNGGNEELAIYSDASRPTFVAQEFAYMSVDRSRLKARAQAGDAAAEVGEQEQRRVADLLDRDGLGGRQGVVARDGQEAFEALEKRQQTATETIPTSRSETIMYRDAFPKEYSIHDIIPVSRNETLEEVAKEFDKMKALGDTSASFAAFVRAMKK